VLAPRPLTAPVEGEEVEVVVVVVDLVDSAGRRLGLHPSFLIGISRTLSSFLTFPATLVVGSATCRVIVSRARNATTARVS